VIAESGLFIGFPFVFGLECRRAAFQNKATFWKIDPAGLGIGERRYIIR